MGAVASKVTGFLARAAGYGTLALIAYDSHTAGRVKATKNEKDEKSDYLAKHYLEEQKLDSPSIVRSAVKKKIFHYNVDENLTGFFSNIGGYFNGFTSMLVNNVVPLGLAAGAAFGPKGFLSKTFGVGLLAYGAIYLLQEAFGIGKSHE